MDNIYLLKKLSPKDFEQTLNAENEKYEVDSALFLTYSIESKTILTSLMSLLDIPDKVDEKELDMKERWERLMQYPCVTAEGSRNMKWQQERIGYVCNDGYDKSVATPIYYYTEGFVSYYKIPEGEGYYSFHPKLYVIKYKQKNVGNPKIYFRFLVGSMNFVNSKNKEFMTCFDLRAYTNQEIDDPGEYGAIDILQKLLNYDLDYKSRYIQNTNLGKVLKHMNIEHYLFHLSDIPEMIVFPDEKEKDIVSQIKGASKIFSPFLSETYLENKRCGEIYTMESELRKKGFLEDEQGEYHFHVYSVPEQNMQTEKLYSHFKAYVFSEPGGEKKTVYAGSVNYTNSAFERNKEILVKLSIPDDRYSELETQLIHNYIKKSFRKNKATEEQEVDIEDQFKRLAVMLGRMLYVQFDAKSVSLKIKKSSDTDLKLRQEIINKWKLINRDNNLCIRLAPIYYENDKRELEIKNGDITLENQDRWMGLHKRNISKNFIIFLTEKESVKARVTIHLNCEDKDNPVFEELQESQNIMRSVQLSLYFKMDSFQASSMTKKIGALHIKPNAKIWERFFRTCVPDLEELLLRCIKEGKPPVEMTACYAGRINEMMRLQKIIRNDCSSAEEKTDYGYLDLKLVNNMKQQFDDLCTEMKQGEK